MTATEAPLAFSICEATARLSVAGLERRDGCARSVQVVDAPAAEPRAVVLLLVEQPPQPGYLRLLVAVLVPERLERMRGHVGCRLVGDLAEVADRELVQ